MIGRIATLVVVLLVAGCPGSVEEPDGTDDDTTGDPADDDSSSTGDDDDSSEAADDDSGSAGGDDDTTLGEDWDWDILTMDLAVDLDTRSATALLVLFPSDSGSVSFEAGGLEVQGVTGAQGPAAFQVVDGRLDVAVPPGEDLVELEIEYGFVSHTEFDGYDPGGFTFLWPYHCGNLFPCHSRPADGLQFSVALTGVPAGMTAVAPSISSDAPSYDLAWAIGDYTWYSLGSTAAGTEVGVWYLPGSILSAIEGTEYLLAAFEWFEQTLGPYPYGSRAGTVELAWGPGGYGGMEHHPMWHIGNYSLSDRSIHVHEAAHGWYGDGIRIRCWEDFVLSEGTVTYLTARAIQQTAGEVAGMEVWEVYEGQLDYILDYADNIAWPDSCGEVDILEDGLFSLVPYIKGACFYRDVAEQVGEETLDQVLSSFFDQYGGDAAGMQDMLDHIQVETGFDPTDLAEEWLRQLGSP